MTCKKCGKELLWMFRARRGEFDPESGTIQTDYLICPKCESIYKQWIESKVHRDAVTPETQDNGGVRTQ